MTVKALRAADPGLIDLAAGVVMAVLGVVEVLAEKRLEGPAWANVGAMVVYGLLFAARSRRPAITGYGYAALVIVLALALTAPPRLTVIFPGLLVFGFTVGYRLRGRASYAYVPTILLAVSLAIVQVDRGTIGDWIFPAVLSVAAYLAGRNVVHRAALAVELHEAAVRREEAQGVLARRAVAGERRRIVREMHDVVAHSISTMVIQAGGARCILDGDPERAEQAAADIERTGRETLVEMRRLLDVMRGPNAPAELEPSPTLADLGALIRRARERGLRVTLRVEGTARAVGAGRELGAYRVVQDALEDLGAHAPDATVCVTVRWTRDALELTIADDRQAAGAELVSVRERVAVYGGELRAGIRSDGTGRELHVRLPVKASHPSDPMSAQGAA